LRHFGHEEVAVLDGGLGVWVGPLASGAEEIETAAFSARERTDDVVSADEVLERLGEEGFVLVDARAAERYRGEVEPIDPVAGHIPGAVNVPYTECGRIADVESDDIVVYCGSGITAAVDVLELHRAGRRARLYPGSWSEWSSRGLPAERG
jgi:thiosulfate/3-mercaptopyruvate sulfurtransferase